MTIDWSNISSAATSPLAPLWLIFWGFVLDRLIGDPHRIPHPVTIIGFFAAGFEAFTNRGSTAQKKVAGTFLIIFTVVGTYFVVWGIIGLFNKIHPWIGLIVSLWLMSTAFASKSLAQAGVEIVKLLMAGDLSTARRKLAWVVGRDTGELSKEEVVRGTVETVAENIVDGVISPLFFALIGGVPLALAYKAVNTLDSMVGYRNDRFNDYGWASARLDDAANFIPARLTALAIALVAAIRGFEWRNALEIVKRDARKHLSPNSGYSESAVAGALGVRLGGWNSYGGTKSFREYMGDDKRKLVPNHILVTINMMFGVGWICLVVGLLIKLLVLIVLR